MLSLSLSVHVSLLYIEDNDIRCPKGFEVIPEEDRETLWSFCLCLCESESANVEYVLWRNGVCGAHQGRPWPPEDHSPRGPWLFRRGTVPLTQTQMLSSTLLLLFCVYVDYLERYSQFMSAQLLVLNFNLYFSEHYMIFFSSTDFLGLLALASPPDSPILLILLEFWCILRSLFVLYSFMSFLQFIKLFYYQ